MKNPLVQLTSAQARRIWLRAQRLDTTEPFGSGPRATPAAVAHLGYLQIDTIYVIERSHHHILYTRIPTYRCEHLHQAQSIDKTVFEYWTHALSYVPTQSLRFYVRQMRQASEDWQRRNGWFGTVSDGDLRKVLSRIRRHGALTIRDIEDEPVEKDYAWASRKPSKRVLELAFYKGIVSPSAGEEGVRVQSLKFAGGGAPRLYHYRLVLIQVRTREQRISGSVDVRIYGSTDGKPVILDARDIAPGTKPSYGFAFQYFQSLEGDVFLPASFMPGRVEVTVHENGRDSTQQNFDWTSVSS